MGQFIMKLTQTLRFYFHFPGLINIEVDYLHCYCSVDQVKLHLLYAVIS